MLPSPFKLRSCGGRECVYFVVVVVVVTIVVVVVVVVVVVFSTVAISRD